MKSSGTLRLLLGPVGAGKTTYAQQSIARSPAIHLDVDTCMVRLFRDDPRPPDNVIAWYLERRERCRGLLWDIAVSALRCGTDVFLEFGLLQRVEREAFYERARAEELALVAYVLDAPRAARRQRVANRNHAGGSNTQIVPPEFFERASDAWEPPMESERATWGLIDL